MPQKDEIRKPESRNSTDSHRLSLLLRTAYFSLRRKCNQICNEHNSNGDQFVILSVLYGNETGVTQTTIVQEAGYDPATTGTMLRQMEEKGLLKRSPHPGDGRAKLVSLSASGRRLYESLWDSTTDMRNELWNCLSKSDQKSVFRILTSIADTMDEFRSATG